MYERFDDESRNLMVRANEQARKLHHEYIGTEHMLLALTAMATSAGYHVLRVMGIPQEIIATEVMRLLQEGPPMRLQGKLPLTPRAKKVIEYTMEEARSLRHDYVGTQHVLLGLLREPEGVAGQVLRINGATLENARQVIAGTTNLPRGTVEHWRGISKLMEECGELIQIAAKAQAFPTGDHPDGKGPVQPRLVEELADVKAAIRYFEEANGLAVDTEHDPRFLDKLAKFRAWGLRGVPEQHR